MKKILFLTRSYPDTFGSATLLCMHRVLNHVAESKKYELHVLCIRHLDEKFEEHVGIVTVHRFNPALWDRMRHSFHNTRKHSRFSRFIEVLTKIVTIPTFPLLEPFTMTLYCRSARVLQQKESFDLVVSEHHGLLTILTGCYLMKKFPKLKHIAILWDPIKGQMATGKLPKTYTNRRINRIESVTCQYTSLQISTVSMKEYYIEHGDIAADHRIYLEIPSILMPEDEVPTETLRLIREDTINIVFSGLLNEYYRDARPIIHLLNQCTVAESINMIFFSKGERTALELESGSFRGRLEYHDYIPLAELHTMYRHADYLLNVSHINANMIPSKIFEYMSYGKPIISTFVTHGDSAQKYLSRYPESVCIDLKRSDEENIKVLNSFLSKQHQVVPFEIVQEEFKENTPDSYLKAIEIVINS